MISKLITIYYLSTLAATLWLVYRHQICFDNELVVRKVLALLFSGYILAVTLIYVGFLHWQDPVLFLSVIAFCPLVWYAILGILKGYGYRGDLRILVLAVTLTMMGLITLYRLDIETAWSLARIIGYNGTVPVVLKQEVYSAIALLGVAAGTATGFFEKTMQYLERSSSGKDTLLWGLLAITLLMLPKLLGLSAVGAQDKSFQPSEFAFKIVFLVFIAKYYESKAHELLLRHYPLKEVVKLVLFISFGVGIFFFTPILLFQREFGTVLLIGLTFIILTTYVTGRFSFFLAGLILIAAFIALGVQVSSHVEKRLVAAWLDWREYAFKPYGGGKLYPGFQLFQAIAAIRLSPWGVGIGQGILKYTNTDKTIVPKAISDFVAIPIAAEHGIIALLVMGIGYLLLLHKALPKYKTLRFRTILGPGISIALMTQGLYNLSSVLALAPGTGIPLPFLSYGGSAVLANFILIGLLLAIVNAEAKKETINGR